MVFQFFLSGAFSMLWNIFNTLQLLMALKLLLVNLPVNVTFIFDFLDETVNFEVIN